MGFAIGHAEVDANQVKDAKHVKLQMLDELIAGVTFREMHE